MFIFTKDVQQNIRTLASKMRMVIVESHEIHLMTQEEMNELNYPDAEKLESGMYAVKMPVQIAVNHYRGLKKAYKKKGLNGCYEYIARVNSL